MAAPTDGARAGSGAGVMSRLDGAAFGIVYGAIMVLAVLLALGEHPDAPGRTAIVLFGSILAVTLAKALAELLAHALATGERLAGGAWRSAWRHSSPTLATANLPTALFLAAAAGWIPVEAAIAWSQAACVALLSLIGARVGWRIDGRAVPALLGALFAGGTGLALAVLKVLIH